MSARGYKKRKWVPAYRRIPFTRHVRNLARHAVRRWRNFTRASRNQRMRPLRRLALPSRRFAIGYSNAARVKRFPKVMRPRKEFRVTHQNIGQAYGAATGGPIPFYLWKTGQSFHDLQFNGMPSTYDNTTGTLVRSLNDAPIRGNQHESRMGNHIWIDQVKMRLCISAPHGTTAPWTGAFCCRAVVLQIKDAHDVAAGGYLLEHFFQNADDINSFYRSRDETKAEEESTAYPYRVLLDKHFTVDSSSPSTEDLQLVFRYKIGAWIVNDSEGSFTAHSSAGGRIVWNLFVEKFDDGTNSNDVGPGLLQCRPSYYGQNKFIWHDPN